MILRVRRFILYYTVGCAYLQRITFLFADQPILADSSSHRSKSAEILSSVFETSSYVVDGFVWHRGQFYPSKLPNSEKFQKMEK